MDAITHRLGMQPRVNSESEFSFGRSFLLEPIVNKLIYNV